MVRAIDVQQVISQISSVEKVQQIQQQHADMQQRYLHIEKQEKDRLAKEKVNHTDEVERAKIREREEQERRNKRENRQQADAALLKATDDEDSEEGGLINITV